MLQIITATSVLIASATATAPSSPAVYFTYTASVTATCVGAACSKGTSKGTSVYSSAQNKTAWLPAAQGGQGAPTIVDFNKRTVFFLQSNNGRCEYTCPLDQVTDLCNSQINPNEFCEFDYVHKAKYIDTNDSEDHYHVNSGIGPLVMAQFDYYLDSTNHQPVEVVAQLQPFGKWLGNISTHYDTFDPKEPAASMFDFTNEQYCEEGSEAQCGNVNVNYAGIVVE